MPRLSRNPVEALARLGYGARGVVYGLVGGLALLAAIGSGGQTGGSRSALQTLLAQPLGRFWLLLIALGLFGFCAWRVLEALTDADRRGSDMKGWAVRGAHLVSGFIYAGLALFAVNLALGRGSGSGEDQAARDWTAWLLNQPFGRWLVGLAGLAVIGAGLGFVAKAWRGRVAERLSLPADAQGWVCALGRMGFAARGVVFLLIGGFLGLAALNASSSEARGLGGALQALQQQPYGWVLLALTALGLFAFGLFGLVQARYRHIDAPDLEDAKAAVARAGS
ncbi:hypothetical protein GGR34_002235 [Microvirga flocculans]|uniref:DUF1206 domain-containing protein n=1 Tax=Microvirga flocculans TaxID=217168 RepID=A0A7W6N8N5_9HYPH|nr:DUF1206 domain-containing protein [Microvirga flocculans]MBB4040578.1 hypothetical protein [Microvirga flocculans]